MAYVSADLVKTVRAKIKPVLAKHGLKGTVSGTGKGTLSLNISAGKVDFIGSHYRHAMAEGCVRYGHYLTRDEIQEEWDQCKCMAINPYWYQEHFQQKEVEILRELMAILQEGNWDKSDIMSDYFNVGWYVDINIGKWDKPYELQTS